MHVTDTTRLALSCVSVSCTAQWFPLLTIGSGQKSPGVASDYNRVDSLLRTSRFLLHTVPRQPDLSASCFSEVSLFPVLVRPLPVLVKLPPSCVSETSLPVLVSLLPVLEKLPSFLS